MNPIETSAAALRERLGPPPEVAVVLGSGLGAFADEVEDAVAADFGAVGFPVARVAGHAGRVVAGRVGERRVAVIGGRVHFYEGHDMATVVLPVRALARWGVRGLVLTSAVGSIDPGLGPGTPVLLADHLNFLGQSPLRGPHDPTLGPRFPDLTHLYSPRARALAQRAAGRPLVEGVYAAMPGPSYETPAEIRMLRTLGATVVGMSTVPEAIAAHAAGMEVLAISIVANLAAGLSPEPLTHAEVTAAMNAAAPEIIGLLRGVVSRW